MGSIISNKLWGSLATIAGAVLAVGQDDPLIGLVAAVVGAGTVFVEKLKDIRDRWRAIATPR